MGKIGEFVKVKGKNMKIRTYNGSRVLNIRDIDHILECKKNETSKKMWAAINKRKENPLINGTDYVFVPKELFKNYINDNDTYSFPKGGYLITASGYAKAYGNDADKDILAKYYGIKFEEENPESKPEIKEEVKGNKAEQIATSQVTQDAASSVNVTLMQEMINNCNKVMDLQMQFIQHEREANEELRGIIKDMVASIALANDNKERMCNLEAMVMELANVEYREWKKTIIDCANKVVTKNPKYKSTSEVLSDSYKLLNKEYGVVWDQEKKEFYNIEGRSPSGTLELEWWIEMHKPQYKNLLIGKLNTLYSSK